MPPFGRILWEENARATVTRNGDRGEGDRLAPALADHRLRRYIGVTPTGLYPPRVLPVIDNPSLRPGSEDFCLSPARPALVSQTMATGCHRTLRLRSNANLFLI
jgi:hypothetical protein